MQVILGIALVLFVVYLYVLFIGWLFTAVGPGFLYGTALVLSFAVPIVYVRTLLKVFGRNPGSPGRHWNWLFVPVIAMVVLIHFDLLWLLHLEAPRTGLLWVLQIQRCMGLVVREAYSNHEVLALAAEMLPVRAGVEVQVLVSAIFKSALIVPLVLMVRGFFSPMVDPRQPALLSYFAGQAIKDLKAVLVGMRDDLVFLVLRANAAIWGVASTGLWAVLLWPLVFMAYLALVPPVIIGIMASVMFLVMHALSLGLIRLVAMVFSGLLAMMERAVILSRVGYAKCPHAQCHEPVPLPVFLCPACGKEHDRLIPGRFGVLRRTCLCGKGRMPTLFWLGKGSLKSVCPYCRKPMCEELFGGSIHVPIYGGPSTGKTMFMMAATWQVLEGKVEGLQARLIDDKDSQAYARAWKPDFEAGSVREKTFSRFPEAFLLSMRRGLGLPSSVYLYDPAGEALQSEADLRNHGFMNYLDGLALLIDPMSLPSFAKRYQGPDLGATTSRMNPEETVTRVVNLLEGLGKLSRRQNSSHRIAVIFTKADIPGFREELGLDRLAAAEDDWTKMGLDTTPKIRTWLAANEPHLLHMLEARFPEIRFFAVSALGHLPQSGAAFQPQGVMDPFSWLLSKRATFARPLLGRVAGRLAEALAVAGVLGLLVVLPAWVLYESGALWTRLAASLKEPAAPVAVPVPAELLQGWRELAAQGDPEGLYQLAKATVREHPNEARVLLRQAADKGHGGALVFLAGLAPEPRPSNVPHGAIPNRHQR